MCAWRSLFHTGLCLCLKKLLKMYQRWVQTQVAAGEVGRGEHLPLLPVTGYPCVWSETSLVLRQCALQGVSGFYALAYKASPPANNLRQVAGTSAGQGAVEVHQVCWCAKQLCQVC